LAINSSDLQIFFRSTVDRADREPNTKIYISFGKDPDSLWLLALYREFTSGNILNGATAAGGGTSDRMLGIPVQAKAAKS